ncbi:MAG: VWA domain-containing protein [Phycisphaerales bacterium]|nr:VWA domain-containing protein [Phycisphaerales bacterium]
MPTLGPLNPASLGLASLNLGPIEFLQPIWLILIPVLVALSLWIARRSLAGLGRSTRAVALAIRVLVIILLAGAIAEPQLRKESKDVAVSAVIDASRSVPTQLQQATEQYLSEAATESKKPDDRLGTITVAKDAIVQSLPSKAVTGVDRQYVGGLDGTNLAAGIQLALATTPKDAAARVALFSDGLETAGSLLQAAEAARAAGVPIDVFPLRYRYDNEVIIDRVVTPGTAREGETMNIRVVITATRPASGRLSIQENGAPIDLDPTTDSMGVAVSLNQGTNVLSVPVPVSGRGAHEFKATFEADRAASGMLIDAIVENNTGSSVTFVSGEGRALVLRSMDGGPDESAELVRALLESGIRCEVVDPGRFDINLTNLNTYDVVIMVNQDAYPYSFQAQEVLRQYVHDTGGGLVMIGGDKAFGAGGWIGSPLEDALPIRLDPPQKRQMPRGALALVIHSVEVPQGTYWGKKICEAAVNSLSRLDYVGIVEYGWQSGVDWTLPMQLKGDGSAAQAAITRLVFGDMPDFDPSLDLALQGLMSVDAGQRHVIVISDGDPNLGKPVLDRYRAANVTISAVGVNPHSAGDVQTLQRMARYTNGTYYEVANNALATLPQIFIKEAQTVKRTLIWEGDAFQPTMVAGVDTLRGIGAVPPISGYVVAADREGLSQVTLRGKEDDPVGAQWQYGLGRSVTFTSDATTRWAKSWPAWGQYKQFWEQMVRWAMRPSGSPNVRVTTEPRGDQTLVVVEAVDEEGHRLPTATFQGRMATPDGQGAPITLRQVGPGRFEALIDTPESGTYVMGMRYAAPPAAEGGPAVEGSVQAAVIKPFADEFRALQDNAALLQQVAERTGGRVLGNDARAADLWNRDGLKMPVSTRAIWLAVAIAGIGLFLADVAVRRVRLDVVKAYHAARRGMHRGRDKTGMQLEGLQAARAKAQERLRTGPGAEAQDRDVSRSGGHAQPLAPTVAKRKFEATDEQARAAPSSKVALGGEAETPEQQKRRATEQKKTGEEEEGMSRLLKAKRRAQDEMKDD